MGRFVKTFLFILIVMIFGLAYASVGSGSRDKLGRMFRLSRSRKTYGEAHFEEPDEYETTAVIQHEPDAVGTILGQLDESGKFPIVFREDKENRLNRHIAVVGASGSGKTYTFTKNYAFQAVKRRESIVVTDPDGGLFADMAGYLQDQGYVVRRFDLANLDKSDGWNCLRTLTDDPTRIEENAEIFSSIVISNITSPKSAAQPIFVDGPKALLKALLLRVALGHDYKPEEKTFASVYQLLQNPLGEEFLDQMFNKDTLTEDEMPCLGPYLSFKQASPNLRGNLLVNLAANLNVLQTRKVRNVLSTDGIDLTLPGEKPCAYFCIFPDSHATYKFIVSLFFSMLFVTLTNAADCKPSRHLDIPVDFLLDEFPSIGVIPDFAKKMATIRKRQMNVCMIFQDITQLQQNYQDSWTTVLGNCATFVDLGINDQFTADMVTKRIGQTTVQVETEQHPALETIFNNLPIFHRRSTGEGTRDLVSFSELYSGLKENDSIILFQYHHPILAKKYPFVLHSEAKKLRPIRLDDIPDLDDEDGRKAYYAEQDRILADYMKRHPKCNDIDRTYEGKCVSIKQQTVWADWIDAFKALYRELTGKQLPANKKSKKPRKNPAETDIPPELSGDIADGAGEDAVIREVTVQVIDGDDIEEVDASVVGIKPDGEPAVETPSRKPQEAPEQFILGDEDDDIAPTKPEPGASPTAAFVHKQESVPEAVRIAEERASKEAAANPKRGGKQQQKKESYDDDPSLSFSETPVQSKQTSGGFAPRPKLNFTAKDAAAPSVLPPEKLNVTMPPKKRRR